MAKFFNRAKVNSATTGTGTLTLGAAVSSAFCTFAEAGAADGDAVAYVIEDGNDFEIGVGTYTASGTTLSRTTVRLSKISGTSGTTKINCSGAQVVYLSPAKEDLISVSADNSFTATEQAQARKNVYAAPFDALAYNGMQLNGSMEVSQENVTTAVTVSTGEDKNTVDCFRVKTSGAAVISAVQDTASSPDGFRASLKCTFSTADASLAAGDHSIIYSKIEGYRVSRLGFGAANAQSVSIGFWVRSSKTGTYHVALRNDASDRSYVVAYTIISADTWEFKTVTFTGDTSGTWQKTTSAGLHVIWAMASGSTFQTTAGAWQAGNFFSVSGMANAGDTTNATFYLTGVIVLPGIELPTSTRSALIMRPLTDEIEVCQRYYEKSTNFGTKVLNASDASYTPIMKGVALIANNAYYDFIFFKTRKRLTPTVTCYPYTTPTNTGRSSNDTGTDYGASSAIAPAPSEMTAGIQNQSGGALTVGSQGIMIFGWFADIRL